jgi:hypothetical protein
VATLAVIAVAPAATLVSALVMHLPDRLAFTWAAGRADATVSTPVSATVAATIGVLAVVAAAAVLAAGRGPFLAGRWMVSSLAVLAWAAAGGWTALAVTAAVAEVPAAPPPPGAEAVLPLLAVLLGGRATALAYGSPSHDPHPGPPDAALPRGELARGAPPSWRHDTMSGFFLTAVLGLALVGAVMWRGLTVAALICWVAGLMTVLLVRMRVDVDERGFGLSVWGRRPAVVLPWSELVEAHAVRIRPLQWGGWGFRVIPARTGPVVRKGPGLVLTLTDGRRLGITLDDPVTPAGLINTHLDRLRGGAP